MLFRVELMISIRIFWNKLLLKLKLVSLKFVSSWKLQLIYCISEIDDDIEMEDLNRTTKAKNIYLWQKTSIFCFGIKESKNDLKIQLINFCYVGVKIVFFCFVKTRYSAFARYSLFSSSTCFNIKKIALKINKCPW